MYHWCMNSRISATATFAGITEDERGMPKPYHHYFITATEDVPSGHSTATIVAITDAPMLADGSHLVRRGSTEVALADAINALGLLPENLGLRQFISGHFGVATS